MNDDGLYERLHESEKRRKVAAVLVDDFHEMVNSVAGNPADFVEVPSIMVQLMCRATLAALAGDFEKLSSFIPRWEDSPLRDRVQVIIDS